MRTPQETEVIRLIRQNIRNLNELVADAVQEYGWFIDLNTNWKGESGGNAGRYHVTITISEEVLCITEEEEAARLYGERKEPDMKAMKSMKIKKSMPKKMSMPKMKKGK